MFGPMNIGLSGPSILRNLIPLIRPPHTPCSDCSHVYLCRQIWFQIRYFLTSTYLRSYIHGVFWKFGPLWWRDGGNEGLLITWWGIRGHHFDDMMRKWGPWWRNGKFWGPLMTQWRNWKPLVKQWRNCGGGAKLHWLHWLFIGWIYRKLSGIPSLTLFFKEQLNLHSRPSFIIARQIYFIYFNHLRLRAFFS